MNFLTERYKEKLELEKYFRKNLIIFSTIYLLIASTYLITKPLEIKIEDKIVVENNKITKNQNTIKDLEDKLKKETNTEDKIKLIENIFSQKSLRVSERLKALDYEVPDNVWLQTFVYENGRIRIKGFSLKEDGRTSEENAYYFEKRLIDSGMYSSVTMTYLKQSSKYGEKVNEFEYILDLR